MENQNLNQQSVEQPQQQVPIQGVQLNQNTKAQKKRKLFQKLLIIFSILMVPSLFIAFRYAGNFGLELFFMGGVLEGIYNMELVRIILIARVILFISALVIMVITPLLLIYNHRDNTLSRNKKIIRAVFELPILILGFLVILVSSIQSSFLDIRPLAHSLMYKTEEVIGESCSPIVFIKGDVEYSKVLSLIESWKPFGEIYDKQGRQEFPLSTVVFASKNEYVLLANTLRQRSGISEVLYVLDSEKQLYSNDKRDGEILWLEFESDLMNEAHNVIKNYGVDYGKINRELHFGFRTLDLDKQTKFVSDKFEEIINQPENSRLIENIHYECRAFGRTETKRRF